MENGSVSPDPARSRERKWKVLFLSLKLGFQMSSFYLLDCSLSLSTELVDLRSGVKRCLSHLGFQRVRDKVAEIQLDLEIRHAFPLSLSTKCTWIWDMHFLSPPRFALERRGNWIWRTVSGLSKRDTHSPLSSESEVAEERETFETQFAPTFFPLPLSPLFFSKGFCTPAGVYYLYTLSDKTHNANIIYEFMYYAPSAAKYTFTPLVRRFTWGDFFQSENLKTT
ncbi:hypothetical protein AMTRI_Chr08g204150 [Amborella trichopoda]